MFLLRISITFLCLIAFVAAQVSTSSKSVCMTKYGTKSIKPVPSSTSTRSVKFTVHRKVTVIPTKTITPKASTKTKVTDVTSTITSTAPQITDVFHTTLTFDVTTTSTFSTDTTITSVTATTITNGGGTSTVSTVADFTPIQSVPGNPPSRKRTEGNHARRVRSAESASLTSHLEERGGKQIMCSIKDRKPYVPNRYPKSVACEKFIKVVTTKVTTTTARKTITRVASKPTSWVTSTRRHTTTTVASSVKASTTVTHSTTNLFSASTTLTSTITSTITNTETVSAAPSATVYPGCSASNFISSRRGRGVITAVWVDNSNPPAVINLETSSAMECCQRCFDRTDCSGTAWYLGTCYMFAATRCAPKDVLWLYSAPDNFQTSGYTVSNGNCGRGGWDGKTN